jgi:hypothetical protein
LQLHLEAAVRGWAKTNGHRISEWRYDKGRSGTLEAVDRPGLFAAIELVNAGAVDAGAHWLTWRRGRLVPTAALGAAPEL